MAFTQYSGPHPPHAIPLACPQAAWRRRAARVPSAWLSWTAQRKRFWTAASTTSTCRHALPLLPCRFGSHVCTCCRDEHAGVAAATASLHVLAHCVRSGSACKVACRVQSCLRIASLIWPPAATLSSAWSGGRPRSRSRLQRQGRAAAPAGRRWHARCVAGPLSLLSTTAMTAPIGEQQAGWLQSSSSCCSTG